MGLITITYCLVKHYGWFKRPQSAQEQQGEPETTQSQSTLDEPKLKECLELNNTWIGNCDEKASILLAMIGVIMTVIVTSDVIKVIRNYIVLPFLQFLSSTDHFDFNFSRFSVFIFLVVTAIFTALSLFMLLNTIRPNIDYDKFYKDNPTMVKKSHIFFGHVAKMAYDEFKTETFNYKNDLQSQVYVNSYIANEKFKNYIEALYWFKMSMLSSFMLFISIIFMQ